MSTIYIFGSICAVAMIIQIVSLIRFAITKNSKYWDLFIGIAIGVFISTIIAFKVLDGSISGLGWGGLAPTFVCWACLISAIIISIIGWAAKKFLGIANTEFSGIGATVSIIIIATNLIVLLLIPKL
ncbi:MAG: hypothetical protein Q4F56_02405 [Candidatus Saccharibacteria bacterium]|nr:hypothetical protein [Candidatus Saccharibacteria bacterium]